MSKKTVIISIVSVVILLILNVLAVDAVNKGIGILDAIQHTNDQATIAELKKKDTQLTVLSSLVFTLDLFIFLFLVYFLIKKLIKTLKTRTAA